MAVKRWQPARPQEVDANGDPYSGGKYYFYIAGSTTPANTYNSSTGLVANSNPVVLDASGRPQAEIWLTVGISYKCIFKTSADVTVWSEDSISGINDASVTLDQWVSGPAPTYVSSTSFTLVGDQTSSFEVGNKLKFTVTAGTVYGTIKTSAFTSLTTVTIDDDVLDSGLSAVSLPLITATANALPASRRATISGNTTLAEATDFPSIKNITATATVTLPVAARVAPGKPVRLKSSTTGDVGIAPNGADTIDGVSATIKIPSYECIELESDGVSAWIITRKSQWDIGDWKPSGYGTAGIGWLKAGQAVSRTTYAGLFAVYGTTYGPGNGSTTFDLPPHQGRGMVFAGTGTTFEAVTASSANGFTVAANNTKWITGMTVVLSNLASFTTTATAGPTYYAVRVSSTNVRLATTLALAQAEAPDITLSGTGTATLTHTFTARTLGEYGGEQTHAMSATELLAHVHNGVHGTGVALGLGGSASGSVLADQNTASTGGNAAMNIMAPFVVGELYIKT